MCEIFPEVDSCCGVASIRVGMMLIAVLSITTGAFTLGSIENKKNMNYEMILAVYKNASNYTDPQQAMDDFSNLISTTITLMAVVFMLSGLVLMFSTFADQEGFAQIFVWVMFLNIVIGFIVVAAVGVECSWLGDRCLLGDMDWLSTATFLLGLVAYLLVWFYFCCVANSYVLNAYS